MKGSIVTGAGAAADFVAGTADLLTDALGFRPFHGTLNLEDLGQLDLPQQSIDYDADEYCEGVHVYPCTVGGVRTAVIRPLVPDYPENKTEIIAPVQLRSLFELAEGDTISLYDSESLWTAAKMNGTTELHVAPSTLDTFDGVVFDLDGTLVDLAVDWPSVHASIEELLADYLEGSLRDYGRNGLFDMAREHGMYDELVTLIETQEVDAVGTSDPLPALAVLEELECPIGICTANAEAAAQQVLDQFEVLDYVDVIVGRNTVPEGKPHPRPLTHCLEEIGVRAGNAVFIGDHESDAETAFRAGTSFFHPEQTT